MAAKNDTKLNKYTTQEILSLANQSTSIGMLCKKIYKSGSAKNCEKIKKILKENNYNFDKISSQTSVLNEEEKLKAIVEKSYSFVQVIESFGLAVNGGNYATLKNYLKIFNIPIHHFDGRPINKNKPVTNRGEVFCKNSPKSTAYVKAIIIKENIFPYKCSCGLDGIWQGKPLTLQLEHKNGNNKDHRLENLEFLCPNCHTQTPTYCSKNRGFRKNQILENSFSYKRPNKLEALFNTVEKRQLMLENLKEFKNYEEFFNYHKIFKNKYNVSVLSDFILKYGSDEQVKVFKQNVEKAKMNFDYPPIAELVALVQKSNLSAVSRTIGCTANGLKKHLIKHNAWPIIK